MIASAILVAALAANAADGDDDIGSWRFNDPSRPVKVTLLAGSVGAYMGGNYGRRLEGVCKNVELQNISKVGAGAFPLKQHFKSQVLKNRRVDPKAEGEEHWLMMGAGLNSIGMPKSTNHHMKNTILLAHDAGMKVIALSPTPWGSDGSSKFKGYEGLQRQRATQLVTDFLMGRLTPRDALGAHADDRPAGPDADWTAIERPDLAVDLYDSRLRDAEADLRDLPRTRKDLERDAAWKREHRDLDEAARQAALEQDAQKATELARWFMKPELRAFDHIHPNAEGHLIIAETICPTLPASWGCDCTALGQQ